MSTAKLVALAALVIALTAVAACGEGSDEEAVATRSPTELNEVQERRAVRDLTDPNSASFDLRRFAIEDRAPGVRI